MIVCKTKPFVFTTLSLLLKKINKQKTTTTKKTQTQKQKQKTEHLNVLEKLTTTMGILSRDGLVLVERKQDMAMEDLI